MPGMWSPCAGKGRMAKNREEGRRLQSYHYNSWGQVIGIMDGNENQTGFV